MDRPLFLFYEEPDPDRWLRWDRYPRRVVRRVVRGKPLPGGVMRWFLNLRAGLDRLGAPYRVNDYRGLSRHPEAWVHVVGKPHVVEKIPAGHPIIYGPGVAAHPYENNFWGRADIRLVLLSCDWFKAMYDRDLPHPVRTAVWPAGIDTERWRPETLKAEMGQRPSEAGGRLHRPGGHKTTDLLIYDKVRWEYDRYKSSLLQPMRDELKQRGLSFQEIRYGHYLEEEYRALLLKVRAMIFLCEHETQGFAYLQALSSGVPILAWDRGGYWQDPSLYPHRVQFAPVTSVPYFDSRCGVRFRDLAEFRALCPQFWEDLEQRRFRPREYVLENLDLARQARQYVELSTAAQGHT